MILILSLKNETIFRSFVLHTTNLFEIEYGLNYLKLVRMRMMRSGGDLKQDLAIMIPLFIIEFRYTYLYETGSPLYCTGPPPAP